MRMTAIPLIAVGVGIVLIGLSIAWPRIIGNSGWSEQQASQHAKASSELHRLAHARAHAQPADHAEDGEQQHGARSFEEAKQRYQRSHAMLEQARSYRQWTATILRWAGGLCSLLGGAVYFILRSAAG